MNPLHRRKFLLGSLAAGAWQPRDNILLLAGVENIGNLEYREHLDLRTGLGVFQPGLNFYAGMKISY